MSNGYAKNQDYCFSCMRKLSPGTTKCPKCGYRHGQGESPAFALQPGTYLANSRYLVGKVLGQGGFGITYVGMDLVLQKKVAIKECFPMSQVSRQMGRSSLLWSMAADNGSSSRDSFVKEARKMAKVDSIPGIVQVLDIFYQNNTAYIVMGFIEGETLKSKLKREGCMTAAVCVRLLKPVLESLEQAHHCGLIHRDISPDNIMIDIAGKPWILDMGAAKDLDMRAADNSLSSIPVKKIGFSPLEQNIRKDIGPWTDVYAMCATIYYCMTGAVPPDAFDRISHDTLTYPAVIPEQVASVLKRGLAIRWGSRIQSMVQLQEELNSSIEPKPISPPIVIRNPADVRVKEGGTEYFSSACTGDNVQAIWHFVSPDGKVDLTCAEAARRFSKLNVSFGESNQLKLDNIPSSLNAWQVYCRYSNVSGSVDTGRATIHVNRFSLSPPIIASHPESISVKKGGAASFSSDGRNYNIRTWHFVSPDGKTDITYDQAAKRFSSLNPGSANDNQIKLDNITTSLNGWKVYCRYSNAYGSTDTRSAYIHVKSNSSRIWATFAASLLVLCVFVAVFWNNDKEEISPMPLCTPTPKEYVKPTPIPTATPSPAMDIIDLSFGEDRYNAGVWTVPVLKPSRVISNCSEFTLHFGYDKVDLQQLGEQRVYVSLNQSNGAWLECGTINVEKQGEYYSKIITFTKPRTVGGIAVLSMNATESEYTVSAWIDNVKTDN